MEDGCRELGSLDVMRRYGGRHWGFGGYNLNYRI